MLQHFHTGHHVKLCRMALSILLGSNLLIVYFNTGFQRVRVENYQARFLAGLRGDWNGWNWETALLYSEAEAEDRSPNINMTLLQQQLALATPDAYNPFSGGCVSTPTYGDCSPSSQAAIDAILVRGELADYHLAHAARADLCRRLGRNAEARVSYQRALTLTMQAPERRFLERRLTELGA